MCLRMGLILVGLLTVVNSSAWAWKVVPEEKDKQSDIKTILVVDDRLIIVTSKNTFDVKLAELDKMAKGAAVAPANNAPTPVAPEKPAVSADKPGNGSVAAPVNANPPAETQEPITEAMVRKKIAESGVWYIFVAHPQRFKIFGPQPQQQYMSMKEGMVFKGAMINKRLYLQNLDQVLFEPTWENGYDFSRYVSDFNKYADAMRKRLIANVNETNAAINDREAALRNIYFLVDQIVTLLKKRNYTQTELVNKDGEVDLAVIQQEDIEPNAMSFFQDLQRKLNKEEHNKRDAEKKIRNLQKEKKELDLNYQQLTETAKSMEGK